MLKEAKLILQKYHTRGQATKHLKSAHYQQLLIDGGHKQEMYEVGGDRDGRLLLLKDLRSKFWSYHVATATTPTPVSSDRTTDGTDTETETEDRMSESVPFGVGDTVKVWWPSPKEWYHGVVTDVDQSDGTFEVHYEDDDYGWYDSSWKVELVD